MALDSVDVVTLISLVLGGVAILIALISYGLLRRDVRDVRSAGGDIDALAVVEEFSQREKKLEERLVDQKVRLEILELRLQRQAEQRKERSEWLPVRDLDRDGVEKPVVHEKVSLTPQAQPVIATPLAGPRVSEGAFGIYRGMESTNRQPISTEVEALRVVMNGPGKVSAREVQRKIGRSREHTARMMNLLYQEGLVERDSTARPFVYSITEKGRRALEA